MSIMTTTTKSHRLYEIEIIKTTFTVFLIGTYIDVERVNLIPSIFG